MERWHELLSPSEEADVLSAVEAPQIGHEEPEPPARRKGLSFGLSNSRDKTLHQGLLSLCDQAVASITNFVTGVIIARATSKEEFGLYMLGFTLILLMTDLQTSLIATPYMVYAPRLKGSAQARYAGSTLIHQVVFSLLITLALACAAGLGLGPKGLGPVLWALTGVGSLIMLREFVRRMCFAGLRIRTAFLLDAAVGTGQICGLLMLVHLRLLSAGRAYWLIGSVCGLAVLCWLWFNRTRHYLCIRESVTDLKKNWMFAKWVFASGLLWTASTSLYPWLLAFFHGTAAAGVFAACLGVVSASNPALLGIQNLVGPKIAHEFAAKGQKALRSLVLKISAALAVPVSLLTFVLIFWGDRFIALLYGRRYSGNGPVVAILALNLLVTAVAFSFSRALFAVERADLDFALNLAAIVIMLTLGLWLVRTYGPLGAASGLLAANVVTSVVRAGAFLRLSARTPVEQEAN